MWLLLILLALPIVEIALFIEVGGWIGLWPTLGLVLLSAGAGMALMRHQGLAALRRLQARLEDGGDPVGPIAHGALILLGGLLLLVPGFFTDALGLLLLIPAVRELLIRHGAARVTVRAARFGRSPSRPPPRSSEAIDAEYEVVEDAGPRRPGRSGWTRQP